jgi:hypothetical protein
MASRSALLKQLQSTTKAYVTKERTRLQNEASVLTAVLKGRTGGKGIQAANTTAVAAVAQASLSTYLSGA